MSLDPASPLARLLAAPAREGRVAWIGLRPERRAPMQVVLDALIDPALGLVGDRHRGRASRMRQVTLIQAEHLAAIGAFLGREPIDPALLRRNIAVAGLNLLALKGRNIRVGDAVLLGTGECHPCSRMEEALGPGGYNAMRGHGGITASVVTGGAFGLGAAVSVLPAAAAG